jgi:hypothetical protein
MRDNELNELLTEKVVWKESTLTVPWLRKKRREGGGPPFFEAREVGSLSTRGHREVSAISLDSEINQALQRYLEGREKGDTFHGKSTSVPDGCQQDQ